MSDTSAFGFGKFVPGFDFLQNLAKSGSQLQTPSSAIPGVSNWVAPTLSVEELDKRIQELKAVQFWLEQNGVALKATIQALEVQKMTLTTLQGMNVNMSELAKAFTARAPEPEAVTSPAAATHTPQPTADPEPATQTAAKTRRANKPPTHKAAAGTTVDPMQWWGSLTQQFQNIASAAMQDVATQAMKDKKLPALAARTGTARKNAPVTTRKPARKKSTASQTRATRS